MKTLQRQELDSEATKSKTDSPESRGEMMGQATVGEMGLGQVCGDFKER